jgi:hypothetical protein
MIWVRDGGRNGKLEPRSFEYNEKSAGYPQRGAGAFMADRNRRPSSRRGNGKRAASRKTSEQPKQRRDGTVRRKPQGADTAGDGTFRVGYGLRDGEAERSGKNVKIAIGIAVLGLLIVIIGLVTASIPRANQSGDVAMTAEEALSVSVESQNQMKERARTFATSIVIMDCCSDPATAEEAKQDALSLMDSSSSGYSRLASTDLTEYGTVDPALLTVQVDEPVLINGTKSFASEYIYKVTARPVVDGLPVNGHYDINLRFANSEAGWLITSASETTVDE